MHGPKLARLFVAMFASTVGCCPNVDDESWTEQVIETLEGDELDEARAGSATDEDRCKAACISVSTRKNRLHHFDESQIANCLATGFGDSTGTMGDAENPWDESHTRVTISCQGQGVDPGFCT